MVGEALTRRLRSTSPRPIAVALSGGGDSLALLLITDDWARRVNRPLLVFTVDHGLRSESAAWTAHCAATAERLGRSFRAMPWVGAKPATGLPAAARRARHRLLAEAARQDGAAVLLLGHTADDIREARVMRQAGSSTPEPREWSPSPVWPEGRGVFLLRPLLGVGRQALRDWLGRRGETWIDDPSNENLRYARARARQTRPNEVLSAPQDHPLELAGRTTERLGVFSLPRSALRDVPAVKAARLVRLAAVCAGGGERLPSRAAVERLVARLRDIGPVVATLAGARIAATEDQVATLAGARIAATEDQVAIFREAGEAARGGLQAITAEGNEAVWDGRFLVSGFDGEVRRLQGMIRRLPSAQMAALAGLPAAARGGLPATLSGARVQCLALDGRARSLVGERFAAAAGLVTREPV